MTIRLARLFPALLALSLCASLAACVAYPGGGGYRYGGGGHGYGPGLYSQVWRGGHGGFVSHGGGWGHHGRH